MKEHGTLVGRDCPESRCHLSSQAWIPSFASCRANSSTAGLSIVLLRKKDVERHLQFCSKRARSNCARVRLCFLAEPDPLFITSFKRDNGFYRVREGDPFGGLSFYTNQTHAWRIQHQSQAMDSFRALPSSRRAVVFKFMRSCRAAWS
jgi:hypothetical protein